MWFGPQETDFIHAMLRLICMILSSELTDLTIINSPLTFRVTDAAVTDAGAAPPLHRFEMFVISEVSLLYGGGEILNNSVELTQHGVQVIVVFEKC